MRIQLSRTPLNILFIALLFGMIPLCVSFEAELCDCTKQQFLGTIDLQHYAECAKLLSDPKPKEYTIYAMKRNTATFVATLCKATKFLVKITRFFSFRWKRYSTLIPGPKIIESRMT